MCDQCSQDKIWPVQNSFMVSPSETSANEPFQWSGPPCDLHDIISVPHFFISTVRRAILIQNLLFETKLSDSVEEWSMYNFYKTEMNVWEVQWRKRVNCCKLWESGERCQRSTTVVRRRTRDPDRGLVSGISSNYSPTQKSWPNSNILWLKCWNVRRRNF